MIKTKYADNMKIDVEIGGFTIHTDLPQTLKGENSALNPFDLFLASFASCTAVFALFYLDRHGIERDGISVDLAPVYTQSGVSIVTIPRKFPKKHEAGLKATIKQCKVGKHVNFPHEVILIRNNFNSNRRSV